MRTFLYKFSDGSEMYREANKETILEIAEYEREHGVKLTYDGFQDFMGVGQKSQLGIIGGTNGRGDGFKSGWHPGLKMHIGGPAHYQKVLKEKGMVEVGNERQKDQGPKKKSYISEEIVKDAIDSGATISGVEAEALIKGESLSEAT